MKRKLKKTLAFTLAEVLITLGIIGVVASTTIPVLMNNLQDNNFKTAYKKAYSILAQATQMIANDNGGTISGIVTSNQTTKNIYMGYLSTIKNCDSGFSAGVCWATATKYFDGTVKTDMWNNNAGLVLKDGTSIIFGIVSANCQSTGFGSPASQSTCGTISIDVNGLQGPNKFGKDMYMVHLLQNKVLPIGTQGDIFSSNPCPGTGWDSGLSCSAVYLHQ